MDYISDLPELVKEKILTFLSIKEAAKTSFLSSKWRHTWTSIPDLVIKDETIKQIDYIFSLRKSPVLKFHLSCELSSSNEDLDRWMVKLQKYGIQELILGLNRYKMPSSFFSCHALRYVNLEKCAIFLPKKFDGFKMLETLELRFCKISEPDFEILVLRCTKLESLVLEMFNEFVVMKIRSKSLRNLDFWGEFKYVHLETPSLEKACVIKFMQTYETPYNCFINVIESLNDIEVLEINKYFLMDLVKGPSVSKFPIVFNKLKEIKIEINVEDQNEVALALQIFQSAPLLQHIKIKVYSCKCIKSNIKNRPNLTIASEYLFAELQNVSISNPNASESVLSFIILMLQSSPVLKKLVFYKVDSSVLIDKLNQFENIYEEVQFIVC
ncbi:hypothetical protein LUZ60_003963 [Juncus effusus]|nr:hypothetical protein LUZ60_003963 [Juncus effusus]